MSRKSKITEAIEVAQVDNILRALDLALQQPNQSYHYLYSYLSNHFTKIKMPLSYADYVIGSHVVYAWMPTILQFKEHPDTQTKVELIAALESARNETANSVVKITEDQLAAIAFPFNGSLVAPSKLLHFLNPEAWPIWDSRVYRGLLKLSEKPDQPPYHYEMQDLETFRHYVDKLRSFVNSTKIRELKERHKDLKGITNLRCLELGLFIAGG